MTIPSATTSDFDTEATGGNESPALDSRHILGMRVDATSYQDASRRIVGWGQKGYSRYVCIASVNNVMHARDDPWFLRVMNSADLVTPDGMPLVWGLRALGLRHASRVYGPTLTPHICERAAQADLPIALYGATREVLERLKVALTDRFPGLRIAYSWAPPFTPLTPDEEADVTEEIRSSGARVVLVGLSTPKQELWMARRKGQLNAAMVGVGAAFDFLAGAKKQAPPWMQDSGLEWLFRLVTEPRRLWKRYLLGNPRFAALFARQLVMYKLRCYTLPWAMKEEISKRKDLRRP